MLGSTRDDRARALRWFRAPRITNESSVRITGGKHRRYDHVFASAQIAPTRAEYLHYLDATGYSDHAPALVDFGA